MNNNNKCRVCLESNSFKMKTSIFDRNIDNISYADKIMLCADIKISPNNNLPSKICSSCLKLLDAAYKFRQLCRQSDMELQQMSDKIQYTVPINNGKMPKLPKEINVKLIKINDETKVNESKEIKQEDVLETTENIDSNHEESESVIEENSDTNSQYYIIERLESEIKIENEDSTKLDEKDYFFNYDDDDEDHVDEHINQSNEVIKENNDTDDDEFEFFETEELEDYQQRRSLPFVGGNNIKPVYICELCGNIFKKKSSLNMHMKRHRNEKTVPCEICGKLFLNSSMMKAHFLTHTGNKPFKCQHCSRRFYRMAKCRLHEKTHSGERPYSCTYCNKTFIHSQSLKHHLLIHKGILQYDCDVCKKKFRLKHHLVQHLQTTLHKENERRSHLKIEES